MKLSISKLYKLITGILIYAFFIPVSQAVPFGLEARSLAMGNTSVVTADIATAAFANPAMLAYQKSEDDFALLLPAVGVYIDDSDGMVDLIDQYQSQQTIYDAAVASSDIAGTLAAANELLNITSQLDGKIIAPQATGALAIGIAGDDFASAVSARADIIFAGGLSNVATNIVDVIDPNFNVISLAGVATTEVGYSIASNFDFGRKVSLGVTAKIISVDGIFFSESLATFDSGNGGITQNSDTALGELTTMDAGIVVEITENIQIGAVVRNLVSDELAFDIPTSAGIVPGKIKFDTTTRAGIAYRGSFFTLGADVDLTENESAIDSGSPLFKSQKTKLFSVGAEFDAFDFAQLRIGLQKNIASGISEGDKNQLITAGIGFWFGFHLDVSVISGDNVAGIFAQTGFKF